MNWKDIFKKFDLDFYFIDVGARGGLEEPWKSYSDIIKCVAFEPDQKESNLLKEDSKFFEVYNCGLAQNKTKLTLNLLNSRGCSSILLPNRKFLDMFPESKRFDVEEKVEIVCDSLDNIQYTHNMKSVDFIKLDTQGTELDILKGAQKSLQACCGLQVEVEFQKMYQNQSLFDEVNKFIRESLGLEIQDLRKTYWKYKTQNKANNNKGRFIFGDALYFRCPSTLDQWIEQIDEASRENKMANIIFVGLIYGYPDYCFKVLETKAAQKYLRTEILNQITKLVIKNNNCFWSFIPLSWKIKIGPRLKKLADIFRPTEKGWASVGESLGAKKKFGGFIS